MDLSRWMGSAAIALLLISVLLPCSQIVPVEGASEADWNRDSFWYYPWGSSGVHKGIDIFAARGTPVLASTRGIVLFSGELPKGGDVTLILGPRWRCHYYAHLASRDATTGALISQGDVIGTVGTTGNAAGTPPHLHYAIASLIPYPWRMRREPQGWKKMVYLNPDELLRL